MIATERAQAIPRAKGKVDKSDKAAKTRSKALSITIVERTYAIPKSVDWPRTIALPNSPARKGSRLFNK